jgi:hypothetical protein
MEMREIMIKPLPQDNSQEQNAAQTTNLEKLAQLVESGGSIAPSTGHGEKQDQIISFTLRIWLSLDQEVKAHRQQLPSRKRPSRNEFIQTAIEEKLQRDRKKAGK